MLIEVQNAEKIIRGNKVLDHVNLNLKSGKIYGIEGTNGSGKTMLMRAICGLIRLTSGTVSIDGKMLGKDMEFPENTGVLIENPGLIEEYTGFMNIKTLASIKKVTSDEEICGFMKRLKLNPDDRKKVKKYSLGMRQKIGIIEAFIDRPELVILDEPFNALDSGSVETVKCMIKEYSTDDRLLLVSCHEKGILDEICDEIYLMEEGKIVEK